MGDGERVAEVLLSLRRRFSIAREAREREAIGRERMRLGERENEKERERNREPLFFLFFYFFFFLLINFPLKNSFFQCFNFYKLLEKYQKI